MRYDIHAIERIQSRETALTTWCRIEADSESPELLDLLSVQLAVTIILDEGIRGAVDDLAVSDRPPILGFAARMMRLFERVRLSPLLYLAESDADVANFLVRHPQAIESLLAEQGDGPDDEDVWAFAQRRITIASDLLQNLKRVAPLLLDEQGIDRRRTEAFLRYIHQPTVVSQLLDRFRGSAEDARAALVDIVEGFTQQMAARDVRPNAERERRGLVGALGDSEAKSPAESSEMLHSWRFVVRPEQCTWHFGDPQSAAGQTAEVEAESRRDGTLMVAVGGFLRTGKGYAVQVTWHTADGAVTTGESKDEFAGIVRLHGREPARLSDRLHVRHIATLDGKILWDVSCEVDLSAPQP